MQESIKTTVCSSVCSFTTTPLQHRETSGGPLAARFTAGPNPNASCIGAVRPSTGRAAFSTTRSTPNNTLNNKPNKQQKRRHKKAQRKRMGQNNKTSTDKNQFETYSVTQINLKRKFNAWKTLLANIHGRKNPVFLASEPYTALATKT